MADRNATSTVPVHVSRVNLISQDSADVRKSALGLIINCVCAPIDRNAGSVLMSRTATATPPVSRTTSTLDSSSTTSKKKLQPTRNSEDLINKIWDSVRSNNGILVLLELIHIKTPITDADSIRALACKALAGLVRYISNSTQRTVLYVNI